MAARLTIWQTHLAQELRRLRDVSDHTQDTVCAELSWSATKLSKIENGNVGISDRDLDRLLDLYGITGRRREALAGKNKRAAGGWFDYYEESGISSDYLDYIRIEDQASRITTYDVTPLLNGLLQTEHYARGVITATTMGRVSADDIERRVELRAERQRILTRASPVELWSVIAEPVLSWPVGGVEAMQEQIDHLIELSEQPNITIQVLPARVGAHPGMVESFTLLRFGDEHVPEVTYVDGLAENRYTIEPRQVETYSLAMDHVRARALGPEDTRVHLADLRKKVNTE